MPGATQEGARTGGWKYQAGHGFRRGQPVYLQSPGKYALATAATGFDGLVGDVRLQQFQLVTNGELDNLLNLTPNTIYSLTGSPGVIAPGTTYPVHKATSTESAVMVSANVGTAGTDVVLPYTFSTTAVAGGVPLGSGTGVLDSSWLPASATGGAIGTQIFAAGTSKEVRIITQLEPVSKTLTYTGSLLTQIVDAYGTQMFSYDVNGNLTSVTGTGKYRSKTFTYSGGNLTSIAVTP
jgi:hypothetical protein